MEKIVMSSLLDVPKAAFKFIQQTKGTSVYAFFGDMGVGKTTFIKAVFHQLGVSNEVTSPTFAIVNEYEACHQQLLYHFDLYRLETIEDALNIGIQEYLDSGNICMIEWPELIEPLLSEDVCRVYLRELPDGSREISL